MASSVECSGISIKDVGDFVDSFVKNPITINTFFTTSQKNNQLSSLSTKYYGEYQQYKLTQLLLPLVNGKVKNERNQCVGNGKVIEMVTVKIDEKIVHIDEEFSQLMKEYSEYQIALVTIVGEQQCGKSFFCDKILNLAEITGNHVIVTQLSQFVKETTPGLKLWNVPFVRGNTCVFLAELTAPINSLSFQILSIIALLTSSTIMHLNPFHATSGFQQFIEQFKSSLNLADFTENFGHEKPISSFLPSNLYNIFRKTNEDLIVSDFQSIDSEFFCKIHKKVLPDAMNSSYRGNNSDLSILPFLTKQCINQGYIKSISNIFKSIYSDLKEKTYENLLFNGMVMEKLIIGITGFLHDGKKINIKIIFEEIIKQLYVSAYQYCIVNYHTSLEENFSSQEPKSMEQLINIFSQTSQAAFRQFNLFFVDKLLHDEYEEKLLNHINNKQQQIMGVNKIKSQEKLRQKLSNIDFHDTEQLKANFKILKNVHSKLDHGRTEIIVEVLSHLSQLQSVFDVNNILHSNISSGMQMRNSVKQKKNIQLSSFDQRIPEIENNIDMVLCSANSKVFDLLKQRENVQKRFLNLKLQLDSLIQETDEEYQARQKTKVLVRLNDKKQERKKIENQILCLKNPQFKQQLQKDTLPTSTSMKKQQTIVRQV